jgi:hypothetical protein
MVRFLLVMSIFLLVTAQVVFSPVRGFEGVAIGASPGQLFPKRDGLLHVPGNFAAYVLGRAIQRRHLGGVCIMRGLCIH